MYELYIEGQLADIDQKISVLLNYAIDDIKEFGSRNTSFSKTIVLPGTAINNRIFGHTHELGSFNNYALGDTNINENFNTAQPSKAELKFNGLLLFKGIFRLTEIIKTKGQIEYEGSLFGDFGGFIANIGNDKLEDLNFDEYNHVYYASNIKDSWDEADKGEGYFYPLIDYGNVSTNKIDYKFPALKPAFYVKEYIDKIFHNAGYTYESEFLNTNFFKSLIVPCNQNRLRKKDDFLLGATNYAGFDYTIGPYNVNLSFNSNELYELNGFTGAYGNSEFTWTEANTTVDIFLTFESDVYLYCAYFCLFRSFDVSLNINGNSIYNANIIKTANGNYTLNRYGIELRNIPLNNGDVVTLRLGLTNCQVVRFEIQDFRIIAQDVVEVDVAWDDYIFSRDIIPKNILQRDFFVWVMKMFNLYITEDKLIKNKLNIIPYKDYYDNTQYTDWTYKMARDKTMNIKPMGMLNSRFYEFKYKDDSDYFNENYKKKYNINYGSRLEDTQFQFSKDKQTLEIGFSPTVLVQYDDTDKPVSVIHKKSGGVGTANEKEDRMDSNIRILIAKEITGVAEWDILSNDGFALSSDITRYGYAGHLDNPTTPTIDINFGAIQETSLGISSYPSNNLFNTYWSGYIAEIADKDSKLMSCHVYLTPIEIAQLDFSIPIFIDGVLWRLNKVEDYDAQNNELVKVELLRIIDVQYQTPCISGWTTRNYEGTRFRNGDEIPQVTDPDEWAALTTPAWCYYDNDPANGAIYGKLYNWYAINDPRGFAPVGYRVPSDEDWQQMIDCLGGDEVAGGKLKSLELWNSPNTGATNESGFNGIPGGYRFNNGLFDDIGNYGLWWSSTEDDTYDAWNRFFGYDTGDVSRYNTFKTNGFSVRLIKE